MRATDLLKKDHAAVKKLLNEFGRTTRRAMKKRQKLMEEIGQELDIHAQIEEEIFYPAVRDLGARGQELVQEAQHEHEEVKELLSEIRGMDMGAEEIAERVKELRKDVLHHASEEEKEMFPEARNLGEERLAELGERLQARKRELAGGMASRGRQPARRGMRKAA